MAKQRVSPRYIFKIHSTRLKQSRWNLTLGLPEARANGEVVSLNDSMMLRWIDELNGLESTEEDVQGIKQAIKRVRAEPNTLANRKEIRRLYGALDALQFKPDMLQLIIDKDKDLHRACRGFKVNGVKYARLLGTNGGVKNSTIIFVSERLVNELRSRIDNNRDNTIPQIPAKLEAYRALTCSGTIPVSMPNGILVVSDAETVFKENVITLNDDAGGEPEMQFVEDYEIHLDESDGYGLMLPSLAERWSRELGLDYVASGMNTRFSWTKGMVFAFDFREFARDVAGAEVVQDVWGNPVNVNDVELVLTTSMLKLWKCYPSLEAYLKSCEENHYQFGIAKTSPRELENERALNYQFIQSYELTDEDIDELIRPTVEEIQDILGGDYRKTLLYLIGTHAEPNMVPRVGPFTQALMADERLFDDPFVKKKVHDMIKKRINDAKIGVLNVHGNYSIVGGDPYALCQHMFGLPVTGLLKAGEIYNKYWLDAGADKLACFRAPMSTHENIRKVSIARGEAVEYWYRYITTCTLINAFDSLANSLNGMD